MLKIHSFGTRVKARVLQPVAVVKQHVVTVTTMYAVVSKGFAGTFNGLQANKSKAGNGTMYATFNNYLAASEYRKLNKMQLFTTITPY